MIPDNVRYFVVDSETTDAGPTASACELGFIEIDENFNVLQEVESLIDPEQMISPGASGIHGLTNKDVENSPTIQEWFTVDDPACYGKLLEGPVVVIGHRVSFDVRFFGPYIPNIVQELCTLRYARTLYPNSPDHKLSTLLYALDLPKSAGAHRVMADVYSAYHLCKHICERTGLSLRQLAEHAAEPMEVLLMPFGKWKDTPFSEVPKSYLRWMRENMKDLDQDFLYTIDLHLNKKNKK